MKNISATGQRVFILHSSFLILNSKRQLCRAEQIRFRLQAADADLHLTGNERLAAGECRGLQLVNEKVGGVGEPAGEHDNLGIEEADQVGDAEAEQVSGGTKDLARGAVSAAGHVGDMLGGDCGIAAEDFLLQRGVGDAGDGRTGGG